MPPDVRKYAYLSQYNRLIDVLLSLEQVATTLFDQSVPLPLDYYFVFATLVSYDLFKQS